MNLGVERRVLIQCRRGLFQPAVRILLMRAIESYWPRINDQDLDALQINHSIKNITRKISLFNQTAASSSFHSKIHYTLTREVYTYLLSWVSQ